MTDDVVELALVGAGRMGRMHLRALDPARGVRVTDVVEPTEDAREALGDKGYRVHPTLADLLAIQHPDGILVAAPTDRHTDVARAALAAGIPVLCEKPAGLAWREIEETRTRRRRARSGFPGRLLASLRADDGRAAGADRGG